MFDLFPFLITFLKEKDHGKNVSRYDISLVISGIYQMMKF